MKTVWLEQLNIRVKQMRILENTYPVARMSVTELKNACTSDLRFISRLKNELGANGIAPRMNRILVPTCKPYVDRIISTLLVPGGRYLITSSAFGISIWDIGHGLLSMNHAPVASFRRKIEGNYHVHGAWTDPKDHSRLQIVGSFFEG